MKNGWKTKPLGEVCSFLNRGISPRYLESGGICVLNQKCIRDHRLSYEPSRRHDVREKKVGSERLIQAGDVLVNSTGTGTLGRVAQVRVSPPEPTTVDSHVTIVRPIPGKFYPEFFGYMLVVIEDAIKDAGEGCGGQTELARSVLADKFSVQYPESLAEQQRIVGILDEAFDGIAIATANAEKNLQNACALFESHLQSVFTQRGEGWVQKRLGDVCVLQRGFDLPTRMRTTGKYPLVSSSGIIDTHAEGPVKGPGVVTGRSGSIGNVFFVKDDYWPLNTVLYVKEFHNNYPKFVYRLLSHFDLKRFATGAGVPTLNRNFVHDERVFIPSSKTKQMEIAEEIDELEAETQRLVSIYQQKQAALDELKKSLLHQAFAGEL